MDELLKNKKIVVVAPHADDEVFGCAGTIMKAKDLGSKVYIILFSIGDLKQYTKQKSIIKKELRLKEFEKGIKIMKVDGYDILYTQTDVHLRLDTISRRDLIAKIERESKYSLDKINPDILILPSFSYNQDHEAVFRAGFTAARPGLKNIKPFPKIVLTYDNPTHFWNTEREKFHPNFYVNISKYFKKKIQVIKAHKSQIRPFPHHLSVKTLESLTRLRGSEVSCEAAEAFMCLRFVI